MQNQLGLRSREKMAIIWIVPNLLAVLTQDSRAFKEEVPIAATAVTRFFLCLLLAFDLRICRPTRRVREGTLTLVSFFMG
jgi:hypothetical protein